MGVEHEQVLIVSTATRHGQYTGAERDYLDSLSAEELLERGIEYERVEEISLDRIHVEASIIDDEHARDLGTSMRGRRGQLTPIAVRARFDEYGAVVYDVIDGFHRTIGGRAAGFTHIRATVLYACSDEEMYDNRILAANSVKSIQFARLAEWMTLSFAQTRWAAQGMTIAQALGITSEDRPHKHLSAEKHEDLAKLKDWIRHKCQMWQRPVGSVYQMLSIVSRANPELVKSVRSSGGGKDRRGVVTQLRLQCVVDAFPGEALYHVQALIMGVALSRRYSAIETEQFVGLLRDKIKPHMNQAQVAAILEKTDLHEPKSKGSKPSTNKAAYERALGRAPSQPDEWVDVEDDRDDWDDIEPTDDDLAEIEGNKPVGANERRKSNSKGELEFVPGALARGNQADTKQLKARILDLEDALEKARHNSGNAELWWRTAGFLTPQERDAMERVLYGGEDLLSYARRYRLTENQIINLIKSAFAKRAITLAHMGVRR